MRLITFNIYNMPKDDVEAINPAFVVSIRHLTETTTQIFTADSHNVTVMADFHGVKTLLENARELK